MKMEESAKQKLNNVKINYYLFIILFVLQKITKYSLFFIWITRMAW